MRPVYAAHQPDLLPYSGFWYKMAKADLFDVKIWDQFVEKGYQRRVKMRDQWVTLPLVKSSPVDPIRLKRIKVEAPGHLVDLIVKRYTQSSKNPPFWDERHQRICDEILSMKTDLLWDFNFQLILLVREILGIETALTFTKDHDGIKGGAGIVHLIQGFNTPMTYFSGTGAKAYMGDCADFYAADIPVVWSGHRAVTGDSILSVVFDYEDPLAVVMAEHDAGDVHQFGHPFFSERKTS